MKISRLRLSGFKSFVDPTELIIEPGLTGIVGPNGCGKSNLLEAMRWAMGESSPKSLRGAGMEDVIFSGTSARPMRNMAEVVIVADNSARTAPAQFNAFETLEISRRIERDAGSAYRVNGKEVRQRDVHLLFADASTGAHSPALVRQGQIGQIINAKPIARRAILEEAAGISGLHSRRHEAELRLKAAEANLQRLNDVLQELEGQLATLKKQARQAVRYRNLSGHIRKAEATSFYLRWQDAAQGVARAEGELTAAQMTAAEAAEEAAAASTAQAEAQTLLPPLREAEAERAAALHRLNHQRSTLDTEEAQARVARERLEARIAQTQTDITREQHRVQDAKAMLAKLAEERDALGAQQANAGAALEAAAGQRDDTSAALLAREQALDQKTREAAALDAQRRSLTQAAAQASARLQRLDADIAQAARQVEALVLEHAALPDIAVAQATLEAAEAALNAARAAVAEAEDARVAAIAREAERREGLNPLERHLDRLKAEAQTLAKLLKAGTPDLFPPLIDSISVAPGYEAALGAALGDDLVAPLDDAAPVHWSALAPLSAVPSLPPGVTALNDLVSAPPALQRRLSQIGVVAAADGKHLQSHLLPGQRLVSIEGGLWRWDGFTAAAEAPTAAAVRLSQRNRLAELDAEIIENEAVVRAARAEHDAARQGLASANAAEHEMRQRVRAADAEAARARQELQRIEREVAQRSQRLSSANDALERVKSSRLDAEQSEREAREAIASLPDGDALNGEVVSLRSEVQAARLAASEARAQFETLKREEDSRRARLTNLERELADWGMRAANAEQHIGQLITRCDADTTEIEGLREIPAQIAEKRSALMGMIADAETRRREAADALAEAEARLASADKLAKEKDAAASLARESRARCEAYLDAQRARLADIAQRVREAMSCEPSDLRAKAELSEGADLPLLEQVEATLERYRREREALGGVNLRAEEEAQECQTRLDTMIAEKADLEAAIAKLRGGIGSLNREGRERLLLAFNTVNEEFKRLFTTLFGGGEAELTLVESDDPLEAGLEILARPPGKKLTSISLLSGGEQALTAMSLIFAVFLSNPAPICVLDEVDAPLDDANVERFCNLLEEMVRRTQTRFLVITHHALTMSRMHRLFGVTMVERGVSQLVSVDLQGAVQVLAAE